MSNIYEWSEFDIKSKIGRKSTTNHKKKIIYIKKTDDDCQENDDLSRSELVNLCRYDA